MDKKFDKTEEEFGGVFYFTNPTNEDYVHLWNNVEYLFPKMSTVPLIMPTERLEDVQEIRKRFAYDLAIREFWKSKEYKRMAKMGNGLPPTFDEKILEPMIEKCLAPMPMSRAKIKKIVSNEERKFKASKAISEKDNPNFIFKDENDEENIKTLGKMPTNRIVA